MPMRFICAISGWSVECGGWSLRSSAAYAKYFSTGIVSTWIFGGVFMSTVGSTVAFTGSAGLPIRDSGVTV